jgi:type I restriction enzyme S subunit
VKADWKKSTLGNVLSTLKNGLNCKQSKDGAGQKISRIESIATAYFDINRVGFSEISESDKAKFKLLKGDILFSHINSPIHVGKTATFNENEDVYHGVNLLLMRPNEEVLPAYLELYLKSLFESGYWLKRCKQSVNQASVNQQDIAQVAIEFPSNVTEQHRIVTLLDEAFADIATAKANAEKNLQNARELFTRISGSVLDQYASTSQSITLEDLVEPDCSLSYGIVQPGDEVPEGLHIVRPVDMNTDVVMLEGLKRIDPALANSYARTTLRGNDILLCVRGTTGTVALAHSELAGANVTRGIVPIRFCPEKISHQFGYYLLRSEPAQLQIQAKTYGTALQQINIRDLRQLTLPVPAPQDQEIIVQRLSALEEETKQLTAAYANKLTALDDLKKSLLHQAFSGFL